MGFLRVLLAVGVVICHCALLLPVGGAAAVEAFYVISGFYMALAYPKYASPGQFYASRLLRLFPAYWVALALAVFYYLVAGHFGVSVWFTDVISAAGPKHAVFFTLVNFFIVGADWLWFLPKPMNTALAIPPIWTVSLELMFYLLCPILLRLRTRWIALLALALVATRVLAYAKGHANDPWGDRFFPFELPFFLAGIVAYRVYATGDFPRSPLLIAAPFVFGATFFFWVERFPLPPVYDLAEYFYSLLLITLIAVALPAIFERSRHSRLDAAIGEFSYPIYIAHYCFVEIFVWQKGANLYRSAAIVLALTLVHAVFLDLVVQRPVDRLRHRLGKSRPRMAHAPMAQPSAAAAD